MQVLEDLSADVPRGVVATVGNYDGLHLGQQAILSKVVERARTLDLPSVVIGFEPHPLAVLRPEAVPPRLLTLAQKQALLGELGMDFLVLARFTPELARTSAEGFVREVLAGRLGIRELYVGEDWSFGHEREGNLALLGRMGAELGFTASGVPQVIWRGERISASRIRRAILEGAIDEAAEMLGRPYSVTGKIARGDRMGKRIGWPTINLDPDSELLPGDGVYAGRVHFPSFPATFDCATNVGTRPTVYENYRRVVESHVLDFSADVYGQRVEIFFLRRLRSEKIFANVMDLSAQIRRDVEATREYFAARRRSEQGGELRGSADPE
ncbi:MAG TPA: bifunctional riboflavin kinase/FAD synthetase [Thermoanaerobaculia bacterium]|nr:bifunctional riboflavin kinase/FAD synthetase [Thermoanaerobaculia bacterium]